jgi:phosphoglycerate kinase
MILRDITEADVAGKKVFVRADLNVPLASNLTVTDATRIERVAKTINYLTDKGAKIVLASHLGRPDGKVKPEFSLSSLLPELHKYFSAKEITFASDCVGEQVEFKVNELKSGELLLLENLRFYPEEEENDSTFASKLAKLADVYINDAFSCSHRVHASISAITNYLPSYAGFLMQEEVKSLDNVLSSASGKSIAIVGGKKVSTKFMILNFLASKVDYLFIAGAMANTFLHAQGVNIGKSYYEDDLKILDEVKLFLKAGHRAQIILPTDFVVESSSKAVEVVDVSSISNDAIIYDVGPETVMNLCSNLKAVDYLLWNGPLGMFEDPRFAASTIFLARFIAKLSKRGKLTSIAGGGDTISALTASGVYDSFSYVSTAGGAFLEYLEGASLPGVIRLERK